MGLFCDFCELMVESACVVRVNMHQFAVQTVSFMAVVAKFRTLLYFFTQLTLHYLVDSIYILQLKTAKTMRTYISDQRFRLGLIESLRQILKASLTNTQIA